MHCLNLAGEWSVLLDPKDLGIQENWPEGILPPARTSMKLPGCLEENGIGDPVGPDTTWTGSEFGKEFYNDDLYKPYRSTENFRFISWLQPETRYLGPVWYSRQIEFPSDEDALLWELSLERTHWETRVWFDGKALGKKDSLCIPHNYNLERNPGQKGGLLIIRVDNRMIWDVGPNAHSISDQTQGSWNGIVGEINLRPLGSCGIKNCDFFGDTRKGSAILQLDLHNWGSKTKDCSLEITSPQRRSDSVLSVESRVSLNPGPNKVFREIEFNEELPLWDEHNPQLLKVDILLKKNDQIIDSRQLVSGLRDISSEGRQILINGKPVFFRGTLECCVFPKTGYPPTDIAQWREIYRKLKEYGMNHMRFHSWCPPEAAFQGADEAGVYLQVECPLWKNQGSQFEGDQEFDNWLFQESLRIVETYGHHPSFVLFNSGNEPDGRDKEFLGSWVSFWKMKDRRRLYTSSSGWPALGENDFHVLPDPRIQAWGEGLHSRINAKAPETLTDYQEICRNYDAPLITHENGQWCVFPDFSEIEKYTGYLKARNFEVFRDILKRRGMESQARKFLYASGKQQLLCYKEEIESNLRTNNISGFQLLGLTDFPGQGTALVGLLNPFWEEKGYCEASDFNQFCNDTVLLARLPKRYYHQEEVLQVTVDLYNFSSTDYGDSLVTVSLKDELGHALCRHVLSIPAEKGGRGLQEISTVSLPLFGLRAPACYKLETELQENSISNSWNIWIYPSQSKIIEGDVLRCSNPSEAILALRENRRVLLTAPPSTILSEVEAGFSSVFWNTSWTEGQAPHTLGMCCNSKHPVFGDFPTENHGDWQWWEPIHDGGAMILDDLPREIEPLIQPIDTWFRSHKLAYLFECRCGGGSLMVSSMNLDSLENKLVSSQLLASIYRYMNSRDFAPTVEVNEEDLKRLFKQKEI